MTPQLSIIVANFNNTQELPALLDSIQQQTLKDLEVIIADGGSDQPCDDVVEHYKNAGLDIRLIRSRGRQYPLASRLAGFDVSNGRAIYFADADDILIGNCSLKIHVDMLLDGDLDIVNFSSLYMLQSSEGNILKVPDFGLADRLSGKNIFHTYLRTPRSYPNLWSKIFSRRLCQKIAQIPVLNHPNLYGAEDRLFTILSMFHANSYRRSDIIGYQYTERANNLDMARKGLCSLFIMIDELIPYLVECGCTNEDASLLRAQIKKRMSHHVRVIADNMIITDGESIDHDVINKLIEHNAIDIVVKSLIIGHPAWDLKWCNTEEDALLTRIAKLKKNETE